VKLYDEFIYQVKNNILLSNELVKEAVNRHLNDVKKSKTKKYPFHFDEEKADFAIRIIRMLRHNEASAAGKQFIMKPYLAFIVAMIFGWRIKKTGLRRFRRVYAEMARKGVKSDLAAAIGIVCLVFDDEPGPQIYTIATQKEQAKIVFKKAVDMLRTFMNESSRMKQSIRIMGGDRPERIICYKNNGFMEPFSSESTTKDGHNPHVVICDEYHAHKTDAMLNVMTSGMGSRQQPLTIIITTAGFNIEAPCYEEREIVINVLKGISQNDQYFGIIWTLDKEDDWHDKKVWIKAAPNIGETPTWEFMEENYKRALEGVTKEVEFKTKLLNIWNTSAISWIPDREVKKVMKLIDLDKMIGRPCLGSIDLAFAAGGDIVSFSLLFLPHEEDPLYYAYPYYFASEEKINDMKRNDRVNYQQWERDSHIISVPGNYIDYEYVKQRIFQSAEQFQLKAIIADRFNTSQIITELINENILVIPFGQGTLSMNTPIDELEMMIKGRKIVIHDNPVTRWMFRNVNLVYDSTGNKKIDRKNKKQKIDGIATMLMCIGGSKDKKITKSTYSGLGPVALS
jgi:phage terminase large subunit-like protein